METMDVFAGRMLSLADFLDNLQPGRFKFSSWVGGDWGGLPDLSCGTTACGLGWASAMPEFQALGLVLSNKVVVWAPSSVPIHPRLKDDDTRDFFHATAHATEVIFGITMEETEFLFTPTENVNDEEGAVDPEDMLDPEDEGDDGRLSRRATAKRLARHIRAFVEYKYGEKRA